MWGRLFKVISMPNFDPASQFTAENIHYELFWKFISKIWNSRHHCIGITGEEVNSEFRFEFSVKIRPKKPSLNARLSVFLAWFIWKSPKLYFENPPFIPFWPFLMMKRISWAILTRFYPILVRISIFSVCDFQVWTANLSFWRFERLLIELESDEKKTHPWPFFFSICFFFRPALSLIFRLFEYPKWCFRH